LVVGSEVAGKLAPDVLVASVDPAAETNAVVPQVE
jgi:hypothetical protein